MLENLVKKAIKKVINESVCDFKKWYQYDFETEIGIEYEEDLTSGEYTMEDIEDSQNDFIYSVIDGFVAEVCDILGIDTEIGNSKYHDELLEVVYEMTKEELRKQF